MDSGKREIMQPRSPRATDTQSYKGAVMPHTDTINYILSAVGMILALPGVMFIAYRMAPRLRALYVIASFIGCVLGYPLTLFIWGTPLDSVSMIAVQILIGTYFIASVTGLIGALLVNFFAPGDQRSRSTLVEY
jgi:membrane associated rhomboid family serine protease